MFYYDRSMPDNGQARWLWRANNDATISGQMVTQPARWQCADRRLLSNSSNNSREIDQQPDRKAIYSNIYKEYILPCVECAKTKKFAKSKKIYVDMVTSLKEQYCWHQENYIQAAYVG